MYTRPQLVLSTAASFKPHHEPLHPVESKSNLPQSTVLQTVTMAKDDQDSNANTTNVEAHPIQTSLSTLFSLRDGVLYPLQTSSELTQSPFMDMVETNFTPSTLSGLCAQDHELQRQSCSPVKILASPVAGSDVQCMGPLPPGSHGVNSGFVSRSISGSPSKMGLVTELVKAHKRTASGEIKPVASPASPPTPIKPMIRGHSRTMSADSNGSRIAEVITSWIFYHTSIGEHTSC